MSFGRFIACSTIAAGAAFTAPPAMASPQARTVVSAQIIDPAGVGVVNNVLAQSGVQVKLFGRPGDAVTLSIPGTVEISNAAGQRLSLPTVASGVADGGLILSEDVMTVSIAAATDGLSGASGSYSGLTIVLAHYN